MTTNKWGNMNETNEMTNNNWENPLPFKNNKDKNKPKLRATAKNFKPKSKLRANAKNFKLKSKLRANAKNFKPKFKLRATAQNWYPTVKEQMLVREALRNKQFKKKINTRYKKILSELRTIFKKVCNFRKKEYSLHIKAEKNKTIGVSNNNAYKELRNYKDEMAPEKIKLLERLNKVIVELSNSIADNVNKNVIAEAQSMIDEMMDQDNLFQKFIENKPNCLKAMKWKNETIGTYEGLVRYLEAAYNR